MLSTDDLSTSRWVRFPGTRNISTSIPVSGAHINLHTISGASLTYHTYGTRSPSSHLSFPNLVGLLIFQQSPLSILKVRPLFIPHTGIISCISSAPRMVRLGPTMWLRFWLNRSLEQSVKYCVLYKLNGYILPSRTPQLQYGIYISMQTTNCLLNSSEVYHGGWARWHTKLEGV